ncbi:MAG TPA: hypothetical protein VKF32_16480 [Thermoanaerobaculia bacterium]|nr:hypothetical protein [Thermoanaerobaculia bacterium]
MNTAPAPGSRVLWNAATVALVVLACILRVLAARGDLWLDEIWSLEWAQKAGSFLGVFTSIHLDNNHYLNTLLLRALGDGAPILAYRALSLAAGCAGVLFAARVFTDRTYAFAAALLAGTSPLLVVLSSEARGYAVSVLCALAALLVFVRHDPTKSRRAGLLFGAICCFGFLGHLGFAHFWLGAAAATAWRAARLPRGRRLAAWLACHALPLALLAFLWAADLSTLRIAGGDVFSPLAVLPSTASLALGGPERGAFGTSALVVLLALLAYGLRLLAREDRPLSALLLVATTVSPAALLLFARPGVLYPRYFAVPLALALVVLARVFAEGFARGGLVRTAAVSCLLAVGAASTARVAVFLPGARGRYSEALRYMASASPGPITVGSDFDFRNETVLTFTARRLGLESRLVYVPQKELASRPPEWFVVQTADLSAEPLPALEDDAGRVFSDRRDFRYGGISGWSWFVYRRVSRGPAR